MPEKALQESLAAVEGEAPSPEFLASLYARMEDEGVEADDDDLPLYLTELVDDRSTPAWPTEDVPLRARRRWAGVAIAAAAVIVIVGLVVDTGRNGFEPATSDAPGGYTTSVLPAAIIHEGDGDVVIGGGPTTGLDLVVAPWYREERSALEDLGFVAGLAVPFDLELPGADQGCPDLLRDPVPGAGAGRRYLPCGGVSAAQQFPGAAEAARGLDVLVAHVEGHWGAIYPVGVPLERTRELDAEFGDEAEAFVLEAFLLPREAVQVVVIVWRTDNLVHLLWDIQLRGAPGGVEAVMGAAASIDNRTTAERPGGGED